MLVRRVWLDELDGTVEVDDVRRGRGTEVVDEPELETLEIDGGYRTEFGPLPPHLPVAQPSHFLPNRWPQNSRPNESSLHASQFAGSPVQTASARLVPLGTLERAHMLCRAAGRARRRRGTAGAATCAVEAVAVAVAVCDVVGTESDEMEEEAAPARQAQNESLVQRPQSVLSTGEGRDCCGDMTGFTSSSQRHASGTSSHIPHFTGNELAGASVEFRSVGAASGSCWQGQSGSGSGQMGHASACLLVRVVSWRGVRTGLRARAANSYSILSSRCGLGAVEWREWEWLWLWLLWLWVWAVSS